VTVDLRPTAPPATLIPGPGLHVLASHPPYVRVYDDVLPDPAGYRAQALAQPFGDVTLGPDVFRGMAVCPDPTVPDRLRTLLPGADATLSFFRRSPAGQVEPNFLHSDAGMGDWTAILYLNPTPPDGDGTTFWEHRPTGAVTGDLGMAPAARDAAWQPWQHVAAHWNRLLLFQADCFHSRALYENYGEGDAARLIQVVFGRGKPHA
jgi:hypothetical protein